jgi:hypothetical protein
MLGTLSEDELNRFEFYNRSHFSRSKIKDILRDTFIGKEVDDEMAIIVGGIAKLFVGDLCDAGERYYLFRYLLHVVYIGDHSFINSILYTLKLLISSMKKLVKMVFNLIIFGKCYV